MAAYYDEFENKYYNPDDNAKKPGQNENWKMIQRGFSKISSTQLETAEGLTLGKGTEDEESLTASELEELKNPSQLETTGGLTLGKGTADEESLTASELEELKNPSQLETSGGLTLGKGTADEESLTAEELSILKTNDTGISFLFKTMRLTGGLNQGNTASIDFDCIQTQVKFPNTKYYPVCVVEAKVSDTPNDNFVIAQANVDGFLTSDENGIIEYFKVRTWIYAFLAFTRTLERTVTIILIPFKE